MRYRSFLPVSTVLIFLALSHSGFYASAQCTACSNYAHDISDCSYNFNAAVSTGQGAMGGVALGCMCITGSGLSNMIDCFNCNDVTGSQLQLLETWITMCNTDKVAGQQAALDCWNTNRDECVPVQGIPIGGGSSTVGAAPSSVEGASPTSSDSSAAASTTIPATTAIATFTTSVASTSNQPTIDKATSTTGVVATQASITTANSTTTPASTTTSFSSSSSSSQQGGSGPSTNEKLSATFCVAILWSGLLSFLLLG